MKKYGFTLIELLIIVAILLIFFSIGFFVFPKIMESVRITKCISNLKQIGAALLIYEEEWGALPPTIYETSDYLETYFKNTPEILTCPSKRLVIIGRKDRDYMYATFTSIDKKNWKWHIPICLSPPKIRGTPEEPIVVCFLNHLPLDLSCKLEDGLYAPLPQKALAFKRDGSVRWIAPQGAITREEILKILRRDER